MEFGKEGDDFDHNYTKYEPQLASWTAAGEDW
jgi:hypothetical protein